MKKTVSKILFLVMSLSLVACGTTSLDEEEAVPTVKETTDIQNSSAIVEKGHEITSSEFPFYFNSADSGMKVTLYFLDDATDLPYIEVNDWKMLSDNFFDSDTKDINFEIDTKDSVVTYTRISERTNDEDHGATMVIDFEDNTISFKDYNLFCKRSSASTLFDSVLMSTVNEAGEPTLLEKVDTGSFTRYGDSLVFSLSDYNIDLIQQDELYLIPLQTLSDIIMPNAAMGCFFFNGQSIILSSDINNAADIYYTAQTGERSKPLAEYGYNELCMMLDYFYGLKETHQITSFDKLFDEVGFDEPLKEGSVKDADALIYRLISDFISDGHSNFLAFSYLNGPLDYSAKDKTRSRVFEILDQQKAARAKYYPDGIPGYEEVGDTAYITFDNYFNSLEPNDYYEINPEDYPEDDVIGLIIKSHAMITRENSPIKNVVLDMSANTGGSDNVSALVVAWMLGEGTSSFVDTLTGAMGTSTYRADVNLDRVFDEKDTLGARKLFCLCSSCSFSNGNYVPCALKASSKVTLLGRATAGGACTVLPASTAWGTSFQISSNQRKSFLKNGAFYDIDRGTEPDYALTSPESFYDRVALTDYINSLP